MQLAARLLDVDGTRGTTVTEPPSILLVHRLLGSGAVPRERPPAPPLVADAVPPAPERAPVRGGRAHTVVARLRLVHPRRPWPSRRGGRRRHARPPPDRAARRQRRQRRQPRMAHALGRASRAAKLERTRLLGYAKEAEAPGWNWIPAMFSGGAWWTGEIGRAHV